MQSYQAISRLLFWVLLLGSTTLSGKNYYLVFNSDCMDRLEYSYEETRAGNEFIVYSVTLSSGEKILMEVGLESRAPVKTLDTQVLTNCEEARQIFDASLATKINNKLDKIYIVTPVNLGGQFRIATVNSASYFQYDGNSVTGNTQQYRFDYQLASAKTGDLSNGDSRGSVYYIENLPLGPCEVINMRQTYGRDNNYLDIYVVPEIGVVEEKSSLANTSYRLSKINNTPFADYLYRVCGQKTTATSNTNTNPQDYGQPSNYGDTDLMSRGVIETQPTQPAVYHTVKKGETLYRIAKSYDVDLADVKVWNQLKTDVIYPGDQLLVSAPVTEQVQSYNQDFTAKGVSGVQSYGTTDLFNTPTANGQPAWTQSSGRHVVQTGETVLSIAQMYGFTEERFRFFNQLGPTERVREGDILVTTDCLPNTSSNSNVSSYSDMQTKGVSSYSTVPENSNYSTPLNQAYEYTNDSNPPYMDSYNDFDQNYPDEFQEKSVETYNTNSTSPQNYSFPPGSTPRSPASTVPTGEPTDNFYSPSNYGPIPGSYNNNSPLSEPQNYNYPANSTDPTNYNNYINQGNQQTKGAVPPTTNSSGNNSSLLYGGYPSNYGNTSGTMVKGLPTGTDNSNQVILTGVKKMHTVKEGETLESIAARYGTSVQRLRALNQMGKNEIVIPFQQIYVQK